MHAFIQHFFGEGTEVEFRNFTLAHFCPFWWLRVSSS